MVRWCQCEGTRGWEVTYGYERFMRVRGAKGLEEFRQHEGLKKKKEQEIFDIPNFPTNNGLTRKRNDRSEQVRISREVQEGRPAGLFPDTPIK
ncbi:hypothetical protein E2C01_042567 [Portunus trituberculatus]|uniref:Uncharacterized protein n=1 Tax=Portunus trituberculatus TaxID=210409 RepID=A0A5B7FWV3_PORTR|nr:hypothetical protein [Portunus trituberculatus]